MVFPNEIQENRSISLTCRADVGSPRGYIQIWKTTQYSNSAELIYISNSTNNTTVNCTEILNITTSYTVTRDDNGAIFRCSSQNNLTKGPGPSNESSRISVFCMYRNIFSCNYTWSYYIVEFQKNSLQCNL